MQPKLISDLISLEGRTVLLTGACGAIGSVIAAGLAELKASLILVDLPTTNGDALKNLLIKKFGIEASFIACNLESIEERKKFIDKILKKYFSIEVLINNAAFIGSAKLDGWAVKFEKQSIETWNRVLDVNLTSIFHLSRDLTPLLKESKYGGSIINISSIYGIYGPDWSLYEGTDMANPASYAVSKGGVLQLTRWLSTTLCPEIRVNAISPGGIYRGQNESFVRRYVDRTPLGRMGNEEDLLGGIIYLATDLSKYVTGQNLSIDGGWGIW